MAKYQAGIIKIMQWKGDNLYKAKEFLSSDDQVYCAIEGGDLIVKTFLQKDIKLKMNDWLVRGIKGNYYIHRAS